ncbi:anthocyanidin 3-O-glucosyltransferase [Sarracenia purpurea var. burkii]
MSAIHAKDLPNEVHGNSEDPFSEMLHKMGLMMPKATALAMNSFEEIDPTVANDLKSKLKMVLNIGPFDLASPPQTSSYSDDSGCLPWLDTHRAASVAYVSFGTILTPPPNELMALAEALEARKEPFLWSFRDTSKLHLLADFLERTSSFGKGQLRDWLRQEDKSQKRSSMWNDIMKVALDPVVKELLLKNWGARFFLGHMGYQYKRGSKSRKYIEGIKAGVHGHCNLEENYSSGRSLCCKT